MADVPTFDEFVKKPSTGGIPSFEEFASSAPEGPMNLMPGAQGSGPTNRFISNFAGAINPVAGISQMASEAADPNIGLKKTIQSHIFQPQADQFTKAGQAVQGQGEFAGMSPAGRASSALGYGMAGALPLVGPAAAQAGEQIGEGDVAGGLGKGAGLITSVKAPLVTKGVGKGMMRGAEPLAESALGIRNVDRAPGMPSKTPGRAALELTSGVRPSTVSRSARGVIADLLQKRDAILASSNAQLSLDPAIQEIDAAIAKARAGNSDAAHLIPMRQQLTEARPGFQGATTPSTIPGQPDAIQSMQSPSDLLAMRQRFGEDYTKFDHARPLSSEAMRVGNRTYGKITNEIHSGVPESAPLDKTVSDLIPVAEGGKAQDLNAGMGQRIMGRMKAPTGALVGAAMGAGMGMERYGPLGILGAIPGVLIPEILASPTVQMAIARSIYGLGKGVKSPLVSRPLQAGPFVPRITPQSLTQQEQPQFARGGIVAPKKKLPPQITPRSLGGQ